MMADERVKDLASAASFLASDDFLLTDGATAGTRKAPPTAIYRGVDVRTHGAVGDGVTDCSTAFAAAVTAALASAFPVVVIPAGTWSVPTWSYTGNVRLTVDGQGRDTALVGNNQNLFAPTGGSLTIRDFTVSGINRLVYASNTATDIDELIIERIRASVATGGLQSSAATNNPTLRLEMRDCYIDGNGTGVGVSFESVAQQVNIEYNEMDDLTTGIRIGDNNHTRSLSRLGTRVYRNWIKNVYRSDEFSAYGIIVYGIYVNIDENIVDGVDGQPGQDIEGIYTKATYGSVSKNRCFNAGGVEGAIVLKGDPPGSTSSPNGNDMTVDGNRIVFSEDSVRAPADPGTQSVTGIYSNNIRSLITNNTVVRLGTAVTKYITGIRIVNGSQDVLIANNRFIDVGEGIVISGTTTLVVSRVIFDGNIFTFNDLSLTAKSTLAVSGLNSDLRISNNVFIGAGVGRGIQIYPLTDHRIRDLEILNNQFQAFVTSAIWLRFTNDFDSTPARFVAIKGNNFIGIAQSAGIDDDWTAPTLQVREGNSFSDKASDTVDLA